MGVEGLEPSRLIRSTDFKSAASTIPPHPRTKGRSPYLPPKTPDFKKDIFLSYHSTHYYTIPILGVIAIISNLSCLGENSIGNLYSRENDPAPRRYNVTDFCRVLAGLGFLFQGTTRTCAEGPSFYETAYIITPPNPL